MSNQKPIIFSTPMVQAILNGNKTQTRRICKHQYWSHSELIDVNINKWPVITGLPHVSCPYGQPGDILYVREAWKISGWDWEDGTALYEYKDLKQEWLPAHDPTEDQMWMLNYIEQLENKKIIEFSDDENFSFVKPSPWKPSIHMPKAAARIWVKVIDVRVERLIQISETDALDEGVKYWIDENQDPMIDGLYKNYITGQRNLVSPYSSFQSLWESIHGEDGWDKNPWVWVVEFEVLSTSGKPPSLQP